MEELDAPRMRALIKSGEYPALAAKAVTIESRTNLLFSFEKVALREVVRDPEGARIFSEGLCDFLHGRGTDQDRFERWVDAVGRLPRRQTRVLTWPLVTVFGFIAQPDRHLFLKPNVTRRAANMYGFELIYRSKPSWDVYACLLAFAEQAAHGSAHLAAA